MHELVEAKSDSETQIVEHITRNFSCTTECRSMIVVHNMITLDVLFYDRAVKCITSSSEPAVK